MSTQKKSQDNGLGDIFLPIIELLNFIILALMKLFIKLTNGALDKYVFKREKPEKKIERVDLKTTKSTTKFDSIGYSVNRKRDLENFEINKKNHALVVGASGSGKSVLLDTLMFSDMREGKNVIFVDPKGDNESMERFIELCRMNNKEFAIFSENYHGPEKIGLNPSKEGNYTQIADRVFKSFTWSEEHYGNKSFNGLKLAVKILCETGYDLNLEVILNKLRELTKLSKSDENYLDADKVDGIITKLSNVVDSEFNGMLKGQNSLSFKEMRESKKCIYIGLPIQGYAETAAAIGKLFLGDVNYSVYKTYQKINSRNRATLSPIGLYVDELSAFVSPEYIQILNKCRGAKLEITSAFQSMSDINIVDPWLCQQVFENSLNWFVMKQRMQGAAEDICGSIGTIEGFKETTRTEDGQKLAAGSERTVEEMLVHPNVIKNLGRGQCVLLRQQPTKIDLLNVKYIDQATVETNLDYFERYGLIRKRDKPDIIDVECSTKEEIYE